MNRLNFDKRNGTHADVLVAVGAADLLMHLTPELVDQANRLSVNLSRDAEFADFTDISPGFRYLDDAGNSEEGEQASKSNRRTKSRPQQIPQSLVFDYRSENEKYKRQQAARKTRDQDIAESRQKDNPDPEFRSYRIARALQADSGLNKFVEEWCRRSPQERQDAVWSGLTGSNFFFDAPLVQLFNPQAAKGYALLKPAGTDRNDKTKDKWAESFDEWLRYRGFFTACSGWFLGSKGEHIRVYCPIPKHIPFRLYQDVARQFRGEALGGSGTKMDCLGALRLARILIERSEAFTFTRPARSISGVWVTHYQSLGQAKAVTAIDRLAMPDWFDLQSREHAELWLETLDEHDKVLRRLSDDISEELGLLKQYRRFLQQQGTDALPEFIRFLAAYGHHVFRVRAQGQWLLPQFTTEKVEAMLQPSYSEILTNPGFQAIAGALRSATVSAQVAKRKGGDYRDIQYGVLPELRRKNSAGRDELMRAIADFITSFNAESARRYEMGKSGFRVSQDEFAAFADLMGRADPELVGSLLCAMATCKLGKEDKEDVAE